MKVTRAQIIARGLSNRCPNCGARTLFKAGTLFQVNKECPSCGLRIERANDEGFFLGSMSLNYGVTIVGFLVPVLLLYLADVFSGRTAAILAVAGAIVIPAVFYRSSRSWWLMNYYLFCRITSPPTAPGRFWGTTRTSEFSWRFSASVFEGAAYVAALLTRRGGRVV